METKKKFINYLNGEFPQISHDLMQSLISENLISPHSITLPITVLEQIESAINAFHEVRTSRNYIESFKSKMNELEIVDPGNFAMANSFDFHINDEGNIKLIEINTNAAFLAMGLQLYRSQNSKMADPTFSANSLREMILNEIKLNNPDFDFSKQIRIAIIDDQPNQQRLYIEFLVYKAIFESFGWEVTICDYRNLDVSAYDFIYNRFTDFFLSQNDSSKIKSAWKAKQFCLSPHPFEYLLMADKERMTEWAQQNYFLNLGLSEKVQETLQSVVPQSKVLTADNKENIWSTKKQWFLKPLRAFGSKQSYKGASISRKVFDQLELNETLAQEFVPAPEVELVTQNGTQKFKFDLRCYGYQGKLQLIIARLYQGQVTNLQTPEGGFALVHFK